MDAPAVGFAVAETGSRCLWRRYGAQFSCTVYPVRGHGFECCGSRHFHFYMKDETLEVKAQDWALKRES